MFKWVCCHNHWSRSRVSPVQPAHTQPETQPDHRRDHIKRMSRRGSQTLPPLSHLDPPIFHLSRNPADYEFYKKIGQGCFGRLDIVLAKEKNSTIVVVRQYDLESLQFNQLIEVQHEMCVSQSLCHPNVASYLTCFVTGCQLWAVEELMHYGSCADVMHSAKPFQNGFIEPIISLVLRDVLKALRYLHSLGYIHRSVRAKHFLISHDGTVKLSGLRTTISTIRNGIRCSAIHDHSSATVNNICWLAPEVLAQDVNGYSKSSDVYSIGIAALELATGEAPYAGLPVTQIMMLKLQGHPPMLMRRDGKEVKLSSRLASIIDRCVDPNPNSRMSVYQLLSQSFFKPRKASYVPLTELIRPVLPLDTSKLSSDWLGTDNVMKDESVTTSCNDVWTFS